MPRRNVRITLTFSLADSPDNVSAQMSVVSAIKHAEPAMTRLGIDLWKVEDVKARVSKRDRVDPSLSRVKKT